MNEDYEKLKTLTETGSVFEHAQRLNRPLEPGDYGQKGPPVILVPKNWDLRALPWHQTNPDRLRAAVHFSDADSFVRYVCRFKIDATQIFCYSDQDGRDVMVAKIDYHDASGLPNWCEHTATFLPVRTVEWARWLKKDRAPMTQTEFALFLEDNTLDVISPTGAELLQIINQFEVEGGVSYQRIQRLQDGSVRFQFQNESKAAAGTLAVPEVFILRFPLYQGLDPVEVRARFRYRLATNGDLKLWFELINPHVVVRDARKQLLAAVAAGTGITAYIGQLKST